MKYLFIIPLLFLAACAHETPISNAASPYTLITPTNSHDAMYRVAFKNYENDDINIHSRKIRHDMVENSINDEYCSHGYLIKHEEVVNEGLMTDFGRQSNYYIYVACKPSK